MSEQQPELYPGWQTVRKIGTGSVGEVYEIQRYLFGSTETAALKVISIPQNESDLDELYRRGFDQADIAAHCKERLAQIIREYSLMAELKGNTNIVSYDDVHPVAHDDGIGWTVLIRMELLPQLTRDLDRICSVGQVVKLGIDLCKALTACRGKGIIHRDITPQNIFLSPTGDYKLGDLGIGKNAGGTKSCDLSYTAPEVCNDQPYSVAADVYSLGMVMYWLLNENKLPFLSPASGNGEAGNASPRRIAGTPLPAPKHSTAALTPILLKACAYTPQDRYRTPQEFMEALMSVASGDRSSPLPGKVSSRSASGGTTPHSSDTKPKSLLSTLTQLLLAAAILVGGVVFLTLPRDTSSTSTPTPQSPTPEMKIPADSLQYDGHSYYLYDDENITSWEEAYVYCRSMGGYLAVIGSAQENNALYSYIKALGYGQVFFGYSDHVEEGTWEWEPAEASDYTNWHVGQPNDKYASDYAQFLELYTDGTIDFQGGWSDAEWGGINGHAFLCEWPASLLTED